LLLLAGSAVGVLVSWGLHPGGQAHRDVACPQVSLSTAQRATLEATQLRLIVRDELARALNGVPATAARPDPQEGSERAPVVAAATPEQLQAHEDARALLQAARSTGRWTNDADKKLQMLMPQLDDEQRDEILGDLFSALNRQEIVSDVDGGPLSR
jgi:hypothetical protein